MKTNRIFLGNIMYGQELVGTAVLLKCKNDEYALLDDVDTLRDVYKIEHNQSTLKTFSTDENEQYYVDKDSLTPYYEKEKQKTLKRIKFDVLLDSRNPRGIEN